MPIQLNAIISKVSSGKCNRFLAGDGITAPDFTINAFPGIFEQVSIDARAAKKYSSSFGEAFSIAKNLDEYQHRICALVPSLADSNPFKVQLQKYRIGMVAAFAKLVPILKSGSDLAAWNFHAKRLLVEASDLYVFATSKTARQVPTVRMDDVFSYLEIPEESLDRAVKALYLNQDL